MEERIKKIIEHYEHAKEKHPFFADAMCSPQVLPDWMSGGEWARPVNEAHVKKWQDIAMGRKVLCVQRPTAERILDAELAEIYEAWNRRDMEQARHEIYDAIAVLLRMEDHLEKLTKAPGMRA